VWSVRAGLRLKNHSVPAINAAAGIDAMCACPSSRNGACAAAAAAVPTRHNCSAAIVGCCGTLLPLQTWSTRTEGSRTTIVVRRPPHFVFL
jgi:hypothetical protein